MLDFQPPVARLTLHYPPLNVIDLAMMDELAKALAEIEARADVSTLVLNWRGQVVLGWRRRCRAYSRQSGRHASEVSRCHSVVGEQQEGNDCQRTCHCLGGGAELAMVCDMVYTVDTAAWGFS